ncbi:SMI1/KNR4 family protein [Lysobacter sp. BMK333-48F3]|uniref:SMI1/KNR4 family protein n=1 Tax=Lysobacter sp. BMK333-48F3 TaxID=2867962 RepID=UPI001C8C3218|nr:SMI1/KNR4 family protein [Lysobacter sp. BMK333-48F3]MBX9400792.1 SMI1/KNR4 family protein [Lysobacter sp. BMK333-48F3]
MLREVRFNNAGPATTQHDIDALKASLGGIALPTQYEQYLLRFNGATPVVVPDDVPKSQLLRVWWPVDTSADTSDHVGFLGNLYRVDDGSNNGLSLLQTFRDIGHHFPPQTLAFADNGGGSRFLFDLRPDRFGQVLFWSYLARDGGDMFAVNPYHNVGWVADDFVDFINRIEVEPDDWDDWEAALSPDSDSHWTPR